nr:TlpA disulfide reductase family protein [Nannocystis pusilla]
MVRLAAFAEAEGRIADAELLLVEGLALWRGEKSCEEALRGLYRRQHGSERGYARHRARLEDGARAQRRAQVLATALAEPKPLPPFSLPRLGDEELRSEALRGRVAVLNLWTTWCTPCVSEMPALQQLADAYAKDPDVAILTINAEPRTDELAAWLAEHEFDLEVLLGARWATDNGYNTLPTTLFLDREGQVVFSHEGASERLVEEFTWRIEALRDKNSPTRRPQVERPASG